MMLGRFFLGSTEARAITTLRDLTALCSRLLSESGAANSAAIASEIITAYAQLTPETKAAFFRYLDTDLAPNGVRVVQTANAYAQEPTPEHLADLRAAAEPPRQELLRRINRAGAGVAAIVAMRRDLLRAMASDPQLRAVDADFNHLLASWFNPGFLNLRQIDWNSSAALLEKLIEHEAVHAITDWADLRRRLQSDRRCFAFFHPQLPGEPLIFVEVALLPAIPGNVAQLIGAESTAPERRQPTVAAFYSISNCEPGLRGVSLGNFLIKRVAEQLRSELRSLRRFCTLSPIPSFAAWLSAGDPMPRPTGAEVSSAKRLGESLALLRARYGPTLERLCGAVTARTLRDEERAALEQCAAIYLCCATTTDRGDPVARFHLQNGARIERINVDADLSAKGARESFGVMVNYLYDLEAIEANNDRFVHGHVVRSRRIGALSPEPRTRG